MTLGLPNDMYNPWLIYLSWCFYHVHGLVILCLVPAQKMEDLATVDFERGGFKNICLL